MGHPNTPNRRANLCAAKEHPEQWLESNRAHLRSITKEFVKGPAARARADLVRGLGEDFAAAGKVPSIA
jgi:hypothetical protein